MSKNDDIQALTEDLTEIGHIDQTKEGIAALAVALVEKGYVKAKPADENPPLKDYKIGEYVEVIKNGDWHKGRVSGIEKGFNVLIYVDTERGPVTVGGQRLIRKVA